MPRKKSTVEASLKSKGFEQIEGDHHYFLYVTIDGKRTSLTNGKAMPIKSIRISESD
jgi:hypothetical protein